MKQLSSLLLAASSLFWCGAVLGADRPHYGGTLRIELRESPASLDPTTLTGPAPASLSRLVFETLIQIDETGRPKPLLASSWQAEPGNQRWRILLRSGVSFSDGTPLDAASVAASLRNSSTEWKVLPDGNSVIIETENPDADVPAKLALVHHAIVRRDGKLIGTGPFTIAQWTGGQHLNLKANDGYWAGRPFLNSIEVEFNKNDRDQMLALDLGKADVAEVAPENIQRTQAQNRVVLTSQPSELMALVFASEPRSEDESHARNALALSIDTAALNNVVLQGGGVPASALLPTWESGYGFVFDKGSNDRRLPAVQRKSQSWKFAFDSADPIQRVIAQRVALNARDAGITLNLGGTGTPDLRLVRLPLASADAHVALIELARTLQLSSPKFSNGSVAETYDAEKMLLQSRRVIPLLHLRSAVAVRSEVHEFSILPDGIWGMENVWLPAERP